MEFFEAIDAYTAIKIAVMLAKPILKPVGTALGITICYWAKAKYDRTEK